MDSPPCPAPVPRRRFWFADLGSTGKLIVTRFNRATGGIEAYNVVVPRINVAANGSVNGGVLAWDGWDGEGWVLRSYMPDLQLWYNDPVLMLQELH
ncbi:hypothetical protein KEM56_000161 [Ascosphaera pollenicola]|nr:hypothetical protein KEM56_000161 [Ascosphaera pollenicola]